MEGKGIKGRERVKEGREDETRRCDGGESDEGKSSVWTDGRRRTGGSEGSTAQGQKSFSEMRSDPLVLTLSAKMSDCAAD